MQPMALLDLDQLQRIVRLEVTMRHDHPGTALPSALTV